MNGAVTLLSIQSDGVEVILNLVLNKLVVVYEEQRVDDGQEDCFDVNLNFLGKRKRTISTLIIIIRRRSVKITDLVFCKLKATNNKRKENGGKHEVDCDGGKAEGEI